MEELEQQLESLTVSENCCIAKEVPSVEKEAYAKRKHENEGETASALVYDDSEAIEDWQGFTPSNCFMEDGISDLIVHNPHLQNPAGNPPSKQQLASIDKEFARISKRPEDVTKIMLERLAVKNDFLTGKWIFFIKEGEIADKVWRKLVYALLSRKLTEALLLKMPARSNDSASSIYKGSANISVKTRDFTDKDEVFEVEKDLRALGIKCDLFYKADIYSHVGIFSRGPYKLPASVYNSKKVCT